ncbi:MAG: hypothetical protein OXG52_06165 [bacterium]|nr:hypothetical protein [bacterium]
MSTGPTVPPAGRHGGDGPAVARALGLDPGSLLDLSQNLNPFAPDVATLAALHLGELRRYPDPAAASRLLAGAMGVDPARLVLTNGAAEAIGLVAGEIGGRVQSEPEFGLHPRGDAGPVWRSDPHNVALAEIIGAAMAVASDHRIEDLGEDVRRGDEPIATVRSGPRPVVVQISGLDAQTDEIARRIEALGRSDAGIGPGDVAVLAPFNTSANSVRARLRSHGFDAQSLEDYDGRPNKRVKVGTYHRAKGLEFKAVFLPHLGRFPPQAKKGSSTEEAAENHELAVSQLFVAMTRARDLVVILHGSRLSPVITPAEDHFERIEP